MEDGIIPGAWNPATGKNDLEVKIPGSLLAFLARTFPVGAVLRDVGNVRLAVQNPNSVFEAADDEGGWLFFRRSDTIERRVQDLGLVPPPVFYVRIRPTGARVVTLKYEPADPADPTQPLDHGLDRVRHRLR